METTQLTKVKQHIHIHKR